MTVFCMTLFRMCAICVSCLWRVEIPHFICNWSLFVRLTRPSYFGMSKQSCRKAGFYILLWSFHGEVVIPTERKKKKRFQLCLLPLLHLPYTIRLHLLVMLSLYCSALNLTEDGSQATAAEKTKGCDLNYRGVLWRSDPHLLGSFVPKRWDKYRISVSSYCHKHPHPTKLCFFWEKDKKKSIFLPKTHWTPF